MATKEFQGLAITFNPFHHMEAFCLMLTIWVTDGKIRLFGARTAASPDPRWTARTRSATRRLRSAIKILRRNPLFACYLHRTTEKAAWYTFSSAGNLPRLRSTTPASLEMQLLLLVGRRLFEDESLSPSAAVEAAQADLVAMSEAGLIELCTETVNVPAVTEAPRSLARFPLSQVGWTSASHNMPH